MNKQTIVIIFGIALISLASAIYPGECETIKFPNTDDVNFTIISNTSSMEGFTWNKTEYDIGYCFPTYLPTGNYSFTWSNYKDSVSGPKIVNHYYSSGSGGTRYETEYVYRNMTKYIERNDTICIDNELDEGSCEETFDSFPYMIGIMLVYLVAFSIFQIISRIRRKKAKQQEEPEQEEPEQEEPEEPIDNLFNPEEE